MRVLAQDLKYSVRLLLRAPGFTLVAVAALAIGIGANTAIFSVVNTLLLQRLPYRDADRLAIVWEHNLPRNRRDNVVAPANFIHWREMNQSFSTLAASSPPYSVTISGDGDPEVLIAQQVTAELFPAMGVGAALGRTFVPDENRPGVRVALISDRLWKRRFGARATVLAQAVQVQGFPYAIIGVMPPRFAFLDSTVDVWLPVGFTAESRTPRGRSMAVIGRLKEGVTFASAQRDMTRVGAELATMFPSFNAGWTVNVVPLREQLTGAIKPALFVLTAAVAFVLLIACANVANLLLARATARQRELAVRAAIGAGRGRLVRQLLTESLLLSSAGGTVGIVLAWWAVRFLRVVAAERLTIPRLELVAIDGWVLGFTLVVAVLSGVIFGIVPAIAGAGANLNESLKEGGRTGSAARGNRARAAFVVVEIALALVLLVGAGLLVRSFVRLIDVSPGFDPHQTITMRVSLPPARYRDNASTAQFYDRFFQELDGLAGIESSGAVSWLPLGGLGAATSMVIRGQPTPPQGQEPVTDVRVITHDYLKAMGIPLIRGRVFNDSDPADARGRVVINETFARQFWPNDDPIGKRIHINWDDDDDEVIGVVGDVKHTGLDGTVRPMTYWPYRRYPYNTMTVVVRAAGDTAPVVNAVAGTLRRLDPGLALAGVRTMEEIVSNSVAERRLTMLLLTVFAGAAVLLAAVGIYGVIAYNVTQRTQEIGIRMALGAQRGDVLRLVVRNALMLVAIGVGTGAVGALLLTRLMRGLLFDVRPGDPFTFVVVSVVLGTVAVAASMLPGLRATRVDPVIALRAE
jgi:putative ABC transport system permease protein